MKLITILLFLLPCIVLSQEKKEGPIGSITGTVKDSANDYGLESVTVLVYKKSDSTLLNYQLTNPSGEFNFQQMPLNVPLLISLTSSGYKSFSRTVKLDSANSTYSFGTIQLGTNFKNLGEVVIEAVLPIRMNGDTLEINPAAFKLDSNAVVEDMLRKVPGVTLWGDGTVTVNGKKVTNVYVDGKPFFGNDPAIATQNLPKNAIDKIQVYTEEDRTKTAAERTPSDSLLTMNIKLKADKKNGYFGKGGVGVGTDQRFEGDLGLQAYNKKTRFGIGAAMNNINKGVEDLQSLLGETTFRSFNPRNRYVANFGGQGINKIYFVGANLQHSFIETTNNQRTNELSIDLTGRGNVNNVSSTSNGTSTTGAGALYTTSQRNSIQDNDTRSMGINYNKRDRDKDLGFRISGSETKSSGNSWSSSRSERDSVGLVSEDKQSSEFQSTNRNINFSGNFQNKDSDERNLKSFSLRGNAGHSENESIRYNLTDRKSYITAANTYSLNRLNNSNSKNWNGGVNFTYNALKRLLFGSNNLWNINVRLTNNLQYSQSDVNQKVSDFDSTGKVYVINERITNLHSNNRISEEPALNLSKAFTKNLSNRFYRSVTFTTNLGGQFLWEKDRSNFSNRNLNRGFAFFTPNSNIAYYYQKTNGYNINLNINHSKNYSIPGLDQLFPIIDTAIRSSINYGNAFLKPTSTNNFGFNLNYNRGNNRNKKADINVNLNGSMGRVKNGITDSVINGKDGSRVTRLVNIDGRRNWSLFGNVNTSIRLKKNVLQFSYSGSIFNSQSLSFIDSATSISRTQNMNNSLRVYFAVADIINFSISQGLNLSNSRQTSEKLQSFKNENHVTSASINLQYPKDFTLSNTLNYVKNKSSKQASALWNAYISYRFMKSKQIEAKFSAMDILRQNKNISISSSDRGINTTVTNGLEQFYMLTISYFPRKFGAGQGGGGRRGPGGGNGPGVRMGGRQQ